MSNRFFTDKGFIVALEISENKKELKVVFPETDLIKGKFEKWSKGESLAKESLLESINDELAGAMNKGYSLDSLGLKVGINPLIEITIENLETLETSIVSSPIISNETITISQYVLIEILNTK